MSKTKKIAIGLSGGIDSSTAAYLLKKEGWDVIGVTLKITPQENRCCDLEGLRYVKKLCHWLDIKHIVLDTTDIFKREIIDYFIKSYLEGLTPNPCVYCNRLIKFGLFLDKIKSFDIEYLATGHYAKIVNKNGSLHIAKNKDDKKTQEYFLSLIRPDILKSLVFPLAEYNKDQVKSIAKEEGIIFKDRPESQDICFVQGKDYSKFIQDSVADHHIYSGQIRHLNGQALGTHEGIYNFTYGQRAGLGISWEEPLYVIDIDGRSNTVIVGEKEHLYKDSFFVTSVNWFCDPDKYSDLTVRARYNSPLYDCKVRIQGKDCSVFLKEKMGAIAPGQIATFYHDDIVIGGGIISKQ